MARTQSYDVILIDIKMPRMDGAEACRRIRRIRPASRVIVMTAYAVDTLVQQALQEGALAVLYKPLDIDALLAIIEADGQKADDTREWTSNDLHR